MENNLQTLFNVQCNIQTELKTLSVLFEDFISKSNKLNAVLKSTFNPITNYLESFQKIVNFGLSTAGGSKDIGTHLSKLLATQRNLDCHLKPIVQNSNESLNNHLAKQLDNWKKKSSVMEKSHQKKSKAIKEEYKKALLKERKLKKNPKKAQFLEEAETQTKKLLDSWKDLEISYIKELMFEEQSRFLTFVNSMTPFFSSQLPLLNEVTKLEEEIQRFQADFKNLEALNPHAQKLLAQYALGCIENGAGLMQNIYFSRNFADDLMSLSSSSSFGRRSILSSISDNVDIKNLNLEKDEGYIGSNPGASETSLKELSANLTLGRENIIAEESISNDENNPILACRKGGESVSSNSGSESCEDDEDESSLATSDNEEETDDEIRQVCENKLLDDEIKPAVNNIRIGASKQNNNIPRHYTISGAFSKAYQQQQRQQIFNEQDIDGQSGNDGNRLKSLSNWSLYPNQAIPMPVYANLNQLQRKMSCIDQAQTVTGVPVRRRPLIHSNSLFTDLRPMNGTAQRPVTLLDMNLEQFKTFTSNGKLDSDEKENPSNYQSYPSLAERTPDRPAHAKSTAKSTMKNAMSTPRMDTNNLDAFKVPAGIIKTKSGTIATASGKKNNETRSGFTSRDPFSFEMDQLEYAKNISVCHSSGGNLNSPDNLSINSFGINQGTANSAPDDNQEEAGANLDSTKVAQKPLDLEKINLPHDIGNVISSVNETNAVNDDLFELPPPPPTINF